jgi:hypothetical protein
MDVSDGIVSLVSFVFVIIPKKKHAEVWEEIMEEYGVPWGNL